MALESVDAVNYQIVVESEALIETESIQNAILYLYAAYYSFNISYPTSSYAVLLFIKKYKQYYTYIVQVHALEFCTLYYTCTIYMKLSIVCCCIRCNYYLFSLVYQ